MISQYLIKYISATGNYTNHDPDNDIFTFKGIRINGVLFDETNLVTVSGTNSMTSAIATAQGTLQANIDAVSGASSIRDDGQDATIATNYSTLNSKIDSVSGASSLRDDAQDAVMVSVSGTLQSEINAILADRAKEERFEAVSGQTLFTLSTISFDPNPAVHDLQVFKNSLKAFQSITGSLAGVSGGDFVKVGTNQVQWLYDLRDGDRVIVREERTGSGSGGVSGGGSVDLTNVSTDIIPDFNGVRRLGSDAKGFDSITLKDTVTADIWKLEIVSGIITAVAVGS